MKKRNLIIMALMASALMVGCGNKEDKTEKPQEKPQVEKAEAGNEDIENKEQDEVEKETPSEKEEGTEKESSSDKADNQEKEDSQDKEDEPEDNEEVSLKEEYLSKLDKIEESMDDLKPLYEGITLEMKKAASEKYDRWDKALNEIYKELQSSLPANEFDDLKNKQIEWIKYKEKESVKAGKEAEGGTLENFLVVEEAAELTKERCYKLVNEYMK